jgi:hypothetical protein
LKVQEVEEHINRLAYLKLKHYISDVVLQALLGIPTGLGDLLQSGLRAYRVEDRLRDINNEMLAEIPLNSGTATFSNHDSVNWAILSLKTLLKYLFSLPEYAVLRTDNVNYIIFIFF